jgi:hypothetical protein
LESKKIGKKVGSFRRREVVEGGIISTTLKNGKIINEDVLLKIKEPRGIASSKKGLFAFSSENKVYLVDEEIRVINNPWFSYIHTVDFCNEDKKLLISSSGFDLLLEYDLDTLEKSYEWSAWENGFNISKDPVNGERIILTRSEIKNSSIKTKVIRDPKTDNLPTAMRAAFINSAHYDRTDNQFLLATFFHEGKLFRINRLTGEAIDVIDNLKNPHGGKNLNKGLFITNTGSGEVITKTDEYTAKFTFKNLPSKPRELGDEEWLQNSIYIDGNIITIDSNRTSYVIFNPTKQLIDIIPYNNNWAIQDLIAFKVSQEMTTKIKSILA